MPDGTPMFCVIDLPPDIPLPAQLFLFWLVLVLWRRAAAAEAAGG